MGHVRLIVGGIIPETDITALESLGVAKVFTPGAGLTEIAMFLTTAVGAKS